MTSHQHHHRVGAEGAGYTKAPQGEDMDWQGQGSCRSMDAEIFYPTKDSYRYTGPAIRVCRECPVWKECADWALSRREELGIWGGLTPGDRRRIWNGQAPRNHIPKREQAKLAQRPA